MKYHYRIWCNDCRGIDPQGCFDGGIEDDDEQFDTPEDAWKAGDKETKACGMWEFEVVDENGKPVEVNEEALWQEERA